MSYSYPFIHKNYRMTIFEILSLSRELERTDLSTLSDNELTAHVRMLTSIMIFISSGMIGEESDRKSLSNHLLKRVYPSLLERHSALSSIYEKWKMIDASLQTLYYGASVACQHQDSCYKDIDDILSSLPEEKLHELQGRELTATLQLIVHSLYGFYFPKMQDEEPDEYERFLKETISSWADSLEDNGSWKCVSEEFALERLRVMDMNSYMLLDKTYDCVLQSAFSYYCHLPAFDTTERLREKDVSSLVLMYDTLDLSGQIPRQKADVILRRIVRLLSTRKDVPEANAVVVAHSCRIVAMEVNRQLTEDFIV